MIATVQANKSMKRTTGGEFTEFKIKRKPPQGINQLSLKKCSSFNTMLCTKYAIKTFLSCL